MKSEAARVAPYETGGVLMGYWARPYSEVVVTATIGPGPNARHEATRFLPDADYQDGEIARLYHGSGRTVTYLGDWHSHPDGGLALSRADRLTLRRIATTPAARAPVPLMAILADGQPWRLGVWGATLRRFGKLSVLRRPEMMKLEMFE